MYSFVFGIFISIYITRVGLLHVPKKLTTHILQSISKHFPETTSPEAKGRRTFAPPPPPHKRRTSGLRMSRWCCACHDVNDMNELNDVKDMNEYNIYINN